MIKKFLEFNEYNHVGLDADIQEIFAELKDNGFASTVTDKGNGKVEVLIDLVNRNSDEDVGINFNYGEIKDKVLQFVEFFTCVSCMFYVYDFTYIPIYLILDDLYTMQYDRLMAVLSITIQI